MSQGLDFAGRASRAQSKHWLSSARLISTQSAAGAGGGSPGHRGHLRKDRQSRNTLSASIQINKRITSCTSAQVAFKPARLPPPSPFSRQMLEYGNSTTLLTASPRLQRGSMSSGFCIIASCFQSHGALQDMLYLGTSTRLGTTPASLQVHQDFTRNSLNALCGCML